eukprot:TRINITY_DN30904_c0_g1_i2.p1 TRINITY_DN30904_c0_g1~~TRINITY_DN30904_c0_g1_i2.p1  ORF type:complete len:453 (+),score=76.47 TRINITY_DN30904_c0_g1_i2:30-1388(+)
MVHGILLRCLAALASCMALALALVSRWSQWLPQASLGRRMQSDAGICAASLPSQALSVRSFEGSADLPAEMVDACKQQKPTHGAWLWPGRDWCWVATKRHACYGRHSWENAQNLAAEERRAPDTHLATLPGLLHAEVCDRPSLGADPLPSDASKRDHEGSEDDELQLEMQEAQVWFRQNVAVYVVSLPTAVARWRRISGRLKELGIEAVRVPGVDVSSTDALEKAKQDGLIPRTWDFDVAKQNMIRLLKNSSAETALRYTNNYGLGTVGCAAAHIRAMWQAASRSRRKGRQLALILEDDVWLEDDFVLKLRRLLSQEAPCDWEVISLRSQCPYGACVSPHLTRVQPDGNEPAEMCRHGVNYGFYAMLYRVSSLISLANLLHQNVWDSSRPACLANDVALASVSDRIAYYAVPSSQVPGFVSLGGGESVRSSLNRRGSATWLDATLQQKVTQQ